MAALPPSHTEIIDEKGYSDQEISGSTGRPVAEAVTEPTAPSDEVTIKRQSLSDIFTIFCAGFALISDGYQNSLMTITNVSSTTERCLLGNLTLRPSIGHPQEGVPEAIHLSL